MSELRASDLGVETNEVGVSCGTWCIGGSPTMHPTTYPEYTDASDCWVRGDRVAEKFASMSAEIERLSKLHEEVNSALLAERLANVGKVHPCDDQTAEALASAQADNASLRQQLADVAKAQEIRAAQIRRMRATLEWIARGAPAEEPESVKSGDPYDYWKNGADFMYWSLAVEARATLAGAAEPAPVDPIIHALNDEEDLTWVGPRSQLPPKFFEVCTDEEYAAQVGGAK